MSDSADEDLARGAGESTDSPAAPPAPKVPGPRRDFIKHAMRASYAGLCVATFYPAFRYITPVVGAPGEVGMLSVGPETEFAPNTARIVRFGDQPVIVVRDASGKFHALSALCTHLQCTVAYRPATGQVHCACHDGTFDLSGRPISGPPPSPLQRYQVDVSNGDVLIRAST